MPGWLLRYSRTLYSWAVSPICFLPAHLRSWQIPLVMPVLASSHFYCLWVRAPFLHLPDPVPLGEVCTFEVKAKDVSTWQSHMSEMWTKCNAVGNSEDCGKLTNARAIKSAQMALNSTDATIWKFRPGATISSVDSFFFFFLFFLSWLPYGMWSSHPSYSCNLYCSCGNVRSLTHCARPWIKPVSYATAGTP